MQITDFYREVRGFSLASVRFAADGRKEVKAARTMNRFYEALETAASAYAEACLRSCPLSRYSCRICAVQEGETWQVTVALVHRIPGTVSMRKNSLHLWHSGFLVKEKSF